MIELKKKLGKIPMSTIIEKELKLEGTQGNEWDATLKSANGKVLSAKTQDVDFIYAKNHDFLLDLALFEGETFVMGTFTLSDVYQDFEYSIAVSPSGSSWTLELMNSIQVGGLIVDPEEPSEFVIQTFKTFPQPEPLQEWDILSVSVKGRAKYENIPSLGTVTKIDRMIKTFTYEVV